MTGTKGYSKSELRRFRSRDFAKQSALSDTGENAKVSVGFETSSHYTRRPKSENTAALSFRRTKNSTRAKYIAPSADVVLMPGTLEKAAIDELLSAELSSFPKKDRISLKDRIKKAAHRESEAYTMYGVETREIFTEEFEIDVVDGAAFRENDSAEFNAFFTGVKKQNSKAFEAIKSFKENAESKFRSFASRLNKLRIDKNSSAS